MARIGICTDSFVRRPFDPVISTLLAMSLFPFGLRASTRWVLLRAVFKPECAHVVLVDVPQSDRDAAGEGVFGVVGLLPVDALRRAGLGYRA